MRLLVPYILLLLCLSAWASSHDDAVNERPPVTGPGLELHWGVDCAATWAILVEQHCDIDTAAREDLRLCAAIYQTPGKAPRQSCPDYAGATQLLRENDCTGLRELLEDSSCNKEGSPPNPE